MCNVLVWFVRDHGSSLEPPIFFSSADASTPRAAALRRWYARKGDVFEPLCSHGALAAYFCDAEVPQEFSEEADIAFFTAVDAYSRAHAHRESADFRQWPAALQQALRDDEIPLIRSELLALISNPASPNAEYMEGYNRGRRDALVSVGECISMLHDHDSLEAFREASYEHGYEEGIESEGLEAREAFNDAIGKIRDDINAILDGA